MPSFCKYGNCHNLGSSTYQGYCNAEHLKRGPEREMLQKVMENKGFGTIREAREFLQKEAKQKD